MDTRIPTLFDHEFFGSAAEPEEQLPDETKTQEIDSKDSLTTEALSTEISKVVKDSPGEDSEAKNNLEQQDSVPSPFLSEKAQVLLTETTEESKTVSPLKPLSNLSLELPSLSSPFVFDKVIGGLPALAVEPLVEQATSSALAKEGYVIDASFSPLLLDSIDLSPKSVDDQHANLATMANKESEGEFSANEPSQENKQDVEGVIELPPLDLERQYYGIGDVAKMFNANISHIRFWTTEFKLKPRTTRKGDRLYSHADIEQLRMIHYLVREKGYTIKGARAKLKKEKTDVVSNITLLEQLRELRTKLAQLHDSL